MVSDILSELLSLLRVLLEKAWLGVQNLYNWLASSVGAPAAFIATAFIVILIPFLLMNILFSRTQSMIERGQAGISGLALKAIGVAVTTFLILYVLGSS